MAEVSTPTRRLGRRLWLRRPWMIVASGLILLFIAGAATIHTVHRWRTDCLYQAAVAEADRLDAGWRLDDLLARREKVPDDVNSALRVRAIVERLPAGWPGILPYDVSFSRESKPPDVRLTKSRIAELREIYEPVAESAVQARALAGYPRGNLAGPRPKVERFEQVGGLNASVDVNFPYGEQVRRLVFLLWIDAKLRVEAGDLETALLDVRAMINAGRSIGDYPGLSAQMVRSGTAIKAIFCFEAALAQGEVKIASLTALQSLIEDEARQPLVMIALRGERASVDDLLEQIHTGKLGFEAIPDFSEYPVWMRAFSSQSTLRESQAALLRLHSRRVETAKQPEQTQIDSMEVLSQDWTKQAVRWGPLERLRRIQERLLLGRGFGAPTWLGMDHALLRSAIAALAAERHRLERGRWPDALDQLVPTYLTAVPADPFAPEPLKLRRLSDGVVIYSVGLDRRDDGGTIDWQLPGSPKTDLGFRLWDVGHRRQPDRGNAK